MRKLKRRLLSTVVAVMASLACVGSAFAATIYFDIAASSVTLTDTKYTGYQYNSAGSVVTITGEHKADNKYIIYQSSANTRATRTDFSQSWVPAYPSMTDASGNPWSTFIKNRKDFATVIETWSSRAAISGRASVSNKIKVTGNSKFDIELRDVWIYTSKQTDGSITYIPSSPKGTGQLTIRYSGDNRLTNIRYHSGTSEQYQISGATTKLILEGSETGTLTVGSKTTTSAENYWASVIGAYDARSGSEGIYIKSGNLWVGSSQKDDCAAIGGGGNGVGVIYIEGGVTTATNQSTGATIGGGIGYTSYGGNGHVYITGGEVYAYNSNNASVVPAVAIGGGSSYHNMGCRQSSVDISGNAKVYAES